MSDKVLSAYQTLAVRVSEYIVSLTTGTEVEPVEFMYNALSDICSLYELDIDGIATVVREANDLKAQADAFTGDPLILVRIVGTLAQNLADVSSCIYDPEQGLMVVEPISRFVGLLLLLQEYSEA